MIGRTLGGQLPDLATTAARNWAGRAQELGLVGLSGVATGLEVIEAFSPTGIFFSSNPGCQTLEC